MLESRTKFILKKRNKQKSERNQWNTKTKNRRPLKTKFAYENLNKIDKLISKWWKRKANKKWSLSWMIDHYKYPRHLKIGKYYAQLYASKLNNLEKMDQLLKRNVSKTTIEEKQNVKNSPPIMLQ